MMAKTVVSAEVRCAGKAVSVILSVSIEERGHYRKRLRHPSEPTDIPVARNPAFVVWSSSFASGPKHALSNICRAQCCRRATGRAAQAAARLARAGRGRRFCLGGRISVRISYSRSSSQSVAIAACDHRRCHGDDASSAAGWCRRIMRCGCRPGSNMRSTCSAMSPCIRSTCGPDAVDGLERATCTWWADTAHGQSDPRGGGGSRRCARPIHGRRSSWDCCCMKSQTCRNGRSACHFPEDRRLAALCRGFLEDPSPHTNIDDWADRLGMSRRTFTRIFRRETGLSLSTWRQQACLLVSACPG